MIHDSCGPANYTAWQNNFCLSFSRAHRSAQRGPRFFALIVEIILVRKSRKTPHPPSPRRSGLFLSPLDSFSSFPRCRRAATRANTHNDTSFRGDSCTSCYSSFIGANITDTPDTKATVMTLAKNVDDTKITFVFTRCWPLPHPIFGESVLLSLS